MAKLFKVKFSLLFIVLLAIFALLFLRLFDVQLLQGEEFYRLAENNRYFLKREKTERAVFLDRYGNALVENKKQYLLLENPDQIYSNKEILTDDEALNILATDSARVTYDFLRVYPYKDALAHVIGYLSPVTADDLKDRSDYPLDERLGRMGLEKYFDAVLHSKAAYKKYEVNALGQQQRVVEYGQASYGQNLNTTIDPYLSLLAYRALAGQKGAVVIMDASNGELLALLSSPSFDPNVFSKNSNSKANDSVALLEKQKLRQQINDYFNNENQVFFDRAVSGTYPPGSIFKLVTATAALENGAIDQNTTVEDEGVLRVGDWDYANWYYRQYGRVEGTIGLVRAIARSNDIFFYKTAEWVGPEQLAIWARLFAFGQSPSIPLDHVAAGLVPDPEWKANVLGENWYLGNTYHYGIGQGDLLVTPLQIAQMTQAIANQGNLCQASLIHQDQLNCQSLAIAEENLELILEGMIAACSQGGTAYPIFPYNARVESLLASYPDWLELSNKEKINRGLMACKTGTAEYGGADERGYRKTHAWTTAIVGLDRNAIISQEVKANLETDLTFENQSSSESTDLVSSITSTMDSQIDNPLQLNSSNDVAQLTDSQLREIWLEQVKKNNNLPEEVIISVLVESDESKPFKEGSEDAAPIIAKIVSWISGEE